MKGARENNLKGVNCTIPYNKITAVVGVSGSGCFFEEIEEITYPLGILDEVGHGYLKLGQSTITLSGGEASRLKLAKELVSK